MKVSQGQSQPEFVAAAIVVLYIGLGTPFNVPGLIATHRLFRGPRMTFLGHKLVPPSKANGSDANEEALAMEQVQLCVSPAPKKDLFCCVVLRYLSVRLSGRLKCNASGEIRNYSRAKVCNLRPKVPFTELSWGENMSLSTSQLLLWTLGRKLLGGCWSLAFL